MEKHGHGTCFFSKSVTRKPLLHCYFNATSYQSEKCQFMITTDNRMPYTEGAMLY